MISNGSLDAGFERPLLIRFETWKNGTEEIDSVIVIVSLFVFGETMKNSQIKWLVGSMSVVLLSSLVVPSVGAATSPVITWKVSSLKPSKIYSTSSLASTNSTGTKVWSVSGSCTLKSGKVTTKTSGFCTLKLALKPSGKYAAKTSSKKLAITGGTSVATTVAPAPTITAGQSNAKKSATAYLKISAFSRQGLIDQLLYEKYSVEDATYGVDSANTDWNVQAGKSAAAYLKLSAFSRQGLIDQLLYEKYTQAQAEYGATKAGL